MDLAAIERQRGRRIDDLFPEEVDRPVQRPYPVPLPWIAPNPYIGHRLTVGRPDSRCECDCGAGPFDTATELEKHQSPYRHPVPSWAQR